MSISIGFSFTDARFRFWPSAAAPACKGTATAEGTSHREAAFDDNKAEGGECRTAGQGNGPTAGTLKVGPKPSRDVER